jgi:hypothetical protein
MKVTLRDMRELKDGTTTAVLIIPPENDDEFYQIRKAAKRGETIELVVSTPGPDPDAITPADRLLRRIGPIITDFMYGEYAAARKEVQVYVDGKAYKDIAQSTLPLTNEKEVHPE